MSLWLGRRNPVRSSGVTAGMLVLLMLAPLLLILPKIEVPAQMLPWRSLGEIASEHGQGEVTNTHNLLQYGMILWGLGCVLMVICLLRQIVLVRSWCREAVASDLARDLEIRDECASVLQLHRFPSVRYGKNLKTPVVMGLIHPVLILPQSAKSWSDETLRMVMLHELGHVKRRDLWTNMAANIACMVHWFNPVVWMLRRRLQNECEYACDAYVISQGANAKQYILALCDVAESCSVQRTPMGVLAMADSASLKSRVRRLMDGAGGSSPWLAIGILAVSASLALGYNLIRLEQPRHSDDLKSVSEEQPHSVYSEKEVNTRLNANPFPAE